MQRLKQFAQVVMYFFIFVILISSVYYFTTEKPRTLFTSFAIFGGDKSNNSNNSISTELSLPVDNIGKIPDVDLMNRFGFLTGHENLIQRQDGKFDLVLSSSPGIPGVIHLDQIPEAIIEIQGLDISEKYAQNPDAKIEIKSAIDQLAEHNNPGNIKTVVFAIDSYPIKEATIILPKLGNVEYLLKCQEFNIEQFGCDSSWEKTNLAFEDLGDTIKFTVTDFTAYAGGGDTETNKANLTIWDETDTEMPYGDQYIYPNDLVMFFANYTNNTGAAITGAGVGCNINFSHSSGGMTFNATKNLYEYSRSFSNYGVYNYSIACDGSLQGYVQLSTSDNVTISEPFSLGLFASPSVSLVTFLTTEPENNQSFIVNTTASDSDGDPFNLTHNYYINNQLITLLNLPFTNNSVSASSQLTYDVSGNGYHFTLGAAEVGDSAEPTYTRSCHDGGCYVFDGGDHLNSSSDLGAFDFGATDNFSIEFWINGSDDTGTIIAKRQSTITNGWEIYAAGGNDIGFRIRGAGTGTTPAVTSTNNPLNGADWVHVVAVRNNGTSQLLLYLNGSLAATASDTSLGSLANSEPIIIGSGPTCCFNGSIDSLRIHNKSLSEAQILENYNSRIGKTNTTLAKETLIGQRWNASAVAIDGNGHNSTPTLANNNATVQVISNTAPSLSSFTITGEPENDNNITASITKTDANSDKVNVTYSWKLNNNYVTLLNLEFNDINYATDSDTVYDFTELGNHFMLGYRSQGDPFEPTLAPSCHDGVCYSFDGQSTGGDRIMSNGDLSTFDFGATDNFSIEFWINSSDDSGTIIGKRVSTVANGWEIHAPGSNDIAFRIRGADSGNTPAVTSTTNPLTGASWVHVVAVRNNGTSQLLLYLNGSLAATASDTSLGSLDSSAPLIIGDGPTCCFNGSIDSVRIYNKSLSEAQIIELYQAGTSRGLHSNVTTYKETKIGEIWNATASPIDEHGMNGTLLGNSNNATVQIPANTAPSITALAFSPASPNSTQNFSAVPTQSDANADTINTTYSWRVNANYVTILNLPFTDETYTHDSETVYDMSEVPNHFILGYRSLGDPFEPQNRSNCKVGQCYQFDGQSTGGDRIMSNGDLALFDFGANDNFSIEFWINSSDDSGTIIGKRPSTLLEGWEVYAAGGNDISFRIKGISSGNIPKVTSTSNPLNGAGWVHVVAVRNVTSDALLLYINGTLETSTSDNSVGSLDNNAPLIIGDGPTCCFNGSLDQIKIYNRSLTVSQIQKNFELGQIGFDNNMTVFNETRSGEVWTAYAVPIDARGFNGTNFTNSVTIQDNTAPTITASLNETNATLTTLSDINGTANYSDSNGDTGTVYFTWFVNDTKNFTQTATSVTSNINVSRIFTQDNFSKGHTIILEATPYDGTTNGTAVNTSSLTVQNIAPQITIGLNETNATLTGLSDINATANYTDRDSDSGTVYFTWFVNDTKNFTQTATSVSPNINVSRLFLEGNFSKGYTIILEATPYDGATNGTPVNTSSLTVGNLQPSISVSVNETNATLTGLSDINATANYTDSDSDTGTVYFTLYRNGTSLITLIATSVSPNINVSRIFLEGNFSKGHAIILEATPYDGVTNGTARNTSSLTVGNSPPTIRVSVNETNSTLTTLSDINATANYTDGDSDTGTVYFTWFVNDTKNVTQTATSVTSNINVSRIFTQDNFSKGHTIILETTPYDGITNGTAVNTSSLTVGNGGPSVSILSSTSSLTSSQSLMVNASYTDQDSDSGTIYFELFVNDVSQLIQSATVAHNRSNVSTFSPNNYAQGNKLIVQVHGQDSASLNGTKVNTSQLTVEAAPSNPPTGSPESGEPGTTPVEPPPECEPEWECGDITKAACIDGKQTVECTDGCGNTKTQSQACQEFCEDSDNGQELTVQGTANGLNPRTKVPFSGTDNCWETGRILEYYCRDNKLTWNTFDCPQGTTCKEGACVAFVPVEPICEDSDVTDKIYDPALPLSNYKYFNPLEKGSVTTVSADGTEKSFDDACRRERLTEFYCDGAKQATKSYICPQGTTCIEGACSGTTCESVYDPACETDFTEIACVNGLQTKECPDISECKGPSKLVTQPCGCTPQYDPACETDFAGVECKDGQKTKSCPDISACQGPAKQLTQYCGCVPDFGDCPNWNEASCNKNKLKITCQDLHGCVEPVKYQKSCSVLEEEFVTEIPPEELEGEYVNGSFVPYYGVKLETVSQDGELIATNNKLVKDFVINENTSSNIEVKVTNTGIKPLSDLKIVFDVPQDSASFITSPAALSSLQPKKTGSFKTTMHIGNIKKSFPVKLNIFTKETYVLYKFYGVVDKIWKYVDKDVVKRLFKRLLPAVFETIPVPVWWLLFFTLPLLLLLQNTHIIDESTFISLTVTRHIDQFGKLYVHSPAYRRYSRMNNVKPLLVKSADEREVRELQKMYKLDEELSELIIASKRKYRPRIITSVSIPPQLKHKYFMLGFVNPLHAFPLYLIQTYIKKARFNGYRDAEIREELLKKGWSLREVDSCLGLAHGTEHEQVYSYIKEHLAKGFTLHDIRTKLVAHGWATNVVKQCLQQRIVPLEPKLNKLSVLDHDGVKKIHDYILHFDLKSLIHQEVQRGVPHEKIFIHLQKVGWHPEIIAQQLKVPITKSKLTHGLELLSDYVSQEVNQGFELDDIKHRLIHKGWRVDILHKLFTERHITASSIVSNYIDRELLDGFTIDEIRVKLLNRGWKHVLIDQIFIEKLVQPTNLILSYVDREMLAGFDTLAIKNKLLRTNWKKELVDTCLHYAIKQPYNIILYYINHTLEQGYSIDDVRAKLLDKGWNKIVVDSCLKLRIDDASSKLLRYIAMELRLGVDIIKIRSSLLKAGWNMRVVDAFIEQRTLQASSLLVTYIDAELKSGYALSAVKQKLLQRGWHQAIVNKCIDVVTKKPRNLVDAYVQRLTQQGHDLITVKKKLLEKGWEKSFVSEVLDPKIRKGHAVILEYVGTMLKKGFVLEQIKQQLYEKGWRKEVVEDALYRELLRYYHVIDGYVAQQLASGQDLGLIREQLLEVGWKEELVNLVFEERFSKKIEEVLKYARGMQQAGLSIDEIRARLSHKGWKQEIIDTLMKKL